MKPSYHKALVCQNGFASIAITDFITSFKNLAKIDCGLDQSPTVMDGGKKTKKILNEIGFYQTPFGLWSKPKIEMVNMLVLNIDG